MVAWGVVFSGCLIIFQPTIALAPLVTYLPDKVLIQQELDPEPQIEFFTVTAYTWTGCRTATGSWPRRGTVAVDPTIIPLGTRLYVEGYGEAVAADTGGAIKGRKLDVYLPTRDECIEWGRREVEIQVLD